MPCQTSRLFYSGGSHHKSRRASHAAFAPTDSPVILWWDARECDGVAATSQGGRVACAAMVTEMPKEQPKPLATVSDAVNDLLDKLDARDNRAAEQAAIKQKMHEMEEVRGKAVAEKIDAYVKIATDMLNQMVEQYTKRGRVATVKTGDGSILQDPKHFHRGHQLGAQIEFQMPREGSYMASIGFWRVVDSTNRRAHHLAVFANADATNEAKRFQVEEVGPDELTNEKMDELLRLAIERLKTARN